MVDMGLIISWEVCFFWGGPYIIYEGEGGGAYTIKWSSTGSSLIRIRFIRLVIYHQLLKRNILLKTLDPKPCPHTT